jgi:hypothetical protein
MGELSPFTFRAMIQGSLLITVVLLLFSPVESHDDYCLGFSSTSGFTGFLFYLFIYSYVHTLFGPFLPPHSTLSLPLPLFPGRTCSGLFSNFVEEKT